MLYFVPEKTIEEFNNSNHTLDSNRCPREDKAKGCCSGSGTPKPRLATRATTATVNLGETSSATKIEMCSCSVVCI